MHLELTEILVCPDCGPGHGLIAFVDRIEERRIVEGRLDCPMCEQRHEVRDGIVRLVSGSDAVPPGAASIPAAGPSPPDPAGGEELPGAAAAMAAALLGPTEGAEILLLATGARVLGAAIADLRPDAAVVTYGATPASARSPGDPRSHSRVYPVVLPADSGVAAFPFRERVLDGVVLSGAPGESFLAHAVRSLSAGGRLVVLSPSPEATAALSELEEVEELAADSRAWVGSRL